MDTAFEAVNRLFEQGYAVKSIAQRLNLSEAKVMKILVTLGHTPTEKAKIISGLLKEGKTPDEISEILRLSKKSLDKYFPYTKGSYNQEYPSLNALKIRKCREKKDSETT